MIHKATFLLLLFLSTLYTNNLTPSKSNSSDGFFIKAAYGDTYPHTEEQNKALNKILAQFDLKDASREEICERWLQLGKERWHYDARYEEMNSTLWPLFEDAGMIHAIYPQQNCYDYLLVHGALLSRIEERWQYACSLWEKGVRFKTIVFLSGKRFILPSEQTRVEDPSITTEADLTKWVYAHSPLPIGIEKVPVIFIDADASEGFERPRTIETVQAWLALHPQPGSCLAISNQPYVEYQHAVFSLLLPDAYSLETVGSAVQEPHKMAILLDTLGKIFSFK
jgi:hypothetical protein